MLEKDLVFLWVRVVCILFLSALITFLVLAFTEQPFLLPYFGLGFCLGLITLFFLPHQVCVRERKITVMNVMGISLKSLDLSQKFTRKIDYSYHHRHAQIWSLFGKKYSRIIQVRFVVKATGKSLRFQGQILTEKGMKELIRKTG